MFHYITFYESQPTGKAVAAAIAGENVEFQFDCEGNLLTIQGSFPGHVPGGSLVMTGMASIPPGPAPPGGPTVGLGKKGLGTSTADLIWRAWLRVALKMLEYFCRVLVKLLMDEALQLIWPDEWEAH